MAYYLVQGAYTVDSWTAMVKDPQRRLLMVQQAIERLGGKLEGAWLAFGEYDWVLICQMPDNVSAAAFSIAISVGGEVKAIQTTPLMTFEEGTEATKKIQATGTQPHLPSSHSRDS
jgi:uncharacterized protein with GYD domain